MKVPTEYIHPELILVCSPAKRALSSINKHNFRKYLFRESHIDTDKFIAQHRHFIRTLALQGCRVVDITSLDLPKSLQSLLNERPNTLFTRDSGITFPTGGVLLNMATPQRQCEPSIMKFVYESLGIPLVARAKGTTILEGGDIIAVSARRLLVGYGPRTNLAGVRFIRDLVTKELDLCDEVVALKISPERINLDGVMMPLDRSTILVDMSAVAPGVLLLTSKNECQVALADAFKDHTLIDVPRKYGYMLATNILHLGGHKAMAYSHNGIVNKQLRKTGLHVVAINGSELVKGSGGLRCMTQAIRYRAAAGAH
jgi:N-dimethylarginine dimethylaminohydrolase